MRANYDGVQSRYCHGPGPRPQDDKTVYLHDHNVTDTKEAGEGTRVFWKKSSGEEGSILAHDLIGADGPSSTVRKILRPDAQRRYAGYCALFVRGTTPKDQGVSRLEMPSANASPSSTAPELISNSLAGFHPHTVASTSQAAFDAMTYADYVEEKVSRKYWKRETMGFARFIQKRGVDMRNRSQFQNLPLEEHIRDRNVASVPREQEVYPKWATAI